MMEIPETIGEAKVISYNIVFGHLSTGKTTHVVGNQIPDDFYGLAICKYPNDRGYYLFYCNGNWEAITDTWHETIEDAKDQGEYEYFGIEDNWVNP